MTKITKSKKEFIENLVDEFIRENDFLKKFTKIQIDSGLYENSVSYSCSCEFSNDEISEEEEEDLADMFSDFFAQIQKIDKEFLYYKRDKSSYIIVIKDIANDLKLFIFQHIW